MSTTNSRKTPTPDADLLSWGAELDELILEWQALDEAWPKGKTAMERWQIGTRHKACLERIAELQKLIAAAEAQTLAL